MKVGSKMEQGQNLLIQPISRSAEVVSEVFRESPSSTEFSPAIVGIGASAGGLEASTKLLQHLQSNTGLAFVVVQHLDPTHESILA